MAVKTALSFTPKVSTGRRQQYVTLENPSAPVADGDGGYTVTWTPLNTPDWWVEIATATPRRLYATSSTLSTATHVVTGPYHPEITTKTRINYGSRILQVGEVFTPDEGNIETVCVCVEVVA